MTDQEIETIIYSDEPKILITCDYKIIVTCDVLVIIFVGLKLFFILHINKMCQTRSVSEQATAYHTNIEFDINKVSNVVMYDKLEDGLTPSYVFNLVCLLEAYIRKEKIKSLNI